MWLVSLRRHRGPGPLISSLCRPQLVGSVLWLAPLVLPRPLPQLQASEADFFQQKKRSCACVRACVCLSTERGNLSLEPPANVHSCLKTQRYGPCLGLSQLWEGVGSPRWS